MSADEEAKEKQKGSLKNALQQKGKLKNAFQVFEELEKETRTLCEEKASLLDIEEKLALKIVEEVEKRRQKKEQLKAEVEDLRRRCEELTTFLNSCMAESAV